MRKILPIILLLSLFGTAAAVELGRKGIPGLGVPGLSSLSSLSFIGPAESYWFAANTGRWNNEYFTFGQEAVDGSVDSTNITTTMAERQKLADRPPMMVSGEQLGANFEYTLDQYVKLNPDFQWLLYFNYGHVDSTWAWNADQRPFGTFKYNTLTPWRAKDKNGDDFVVWFASGDVPGTDPPSTYAVDFVTDTDPATADTDRIDTYLEGWWNDYIQGMDHTPQGIMMDYAFNPASGYNWYPAVNDTLDLDQDGIGYFNDSDEQEAFEAAQLYYVDKIRALAGTNFLVLSNGLYAWPEGGTDLLAKLDGVMMEGIPEHPWSTGSPRKGYRATDNLWDMWQDNPYRSDPPSVLLDFRSTDIVTGTEADVNRGMALMFDATFFPRIREDNGVETNSRFDDDTWDAWVDSLGTPIGDPFVQSGTQGSTTETHVYRRLFSERYLDLTVDPDNASPSQWGAPEIKDYAAGSFNIASFAPVSGDSTRVSITFSANVDTNTASLEANYAVSPTGASIPALTITNALPVTLSAVTLKVSPKLYEGLSMDFTAQNVETPGGDVLAPGSGATYIGKDVYPPAVASISQPDTSSFKLRVVFNDTLDTSGAITFGGFYTTASGLTGDSVTKIDYRTVDVTWDGAMVNLTTDSLYVNSAIEDDNDNPINGTTPWKFTTLGVDETAPTLVSATNTDTTNVVLAFDEELDTTTAQTTGNYTIFLSSGDSTGAVSLSTASLSTDEVTVTPASDFTAGETYTVLVKGVEDTSGNAIVREQDSFTTPSPASAPATGDLAISSPIIATFLYNEDLSALSQSEIDSIAGLATYAIGLGSSANESLLGASDPVYLGGMTYKSITDDTGAPSFYTNNVGSYASIDSVGDFYLHFSEYTEITVGNAPNETTYTMQAGERAWNYNPNRFLPAVHTADTKDARVDLIIDAMNASFGASGKLGVWLDNANLSFFNVTSVDSGGGIEEHPTNAAFNSSTFNDWYFFGTGDATTDGMLGVMQQLYTDRDTEAPGKLIWGNVGGVYPADTNDFWAAYIDNGPIADYMTWEFQPKTWLPGGNAPGVLGHTNWVTLIHDMARELLAVGTIPHFTPQAAGTAGGETPATTAELYRHWAAMLTYSPHPDSLAYMPSQHSNDLETYSTWIEQESQAFQYFDLGEPVEYSPQLEDSGTDGESQDYAIYSRDYQNGTAIYRSKKGNTEGATTEVSLSLGGAFYEVDTDGTYDTGSPISSINIGNNVGKILKSAGPQGTYTLLEAPTLSGTTTDMPVPIPESLGDGPFLVTKSDGITHLHSDGGWFRADSLYTGIEFRVYEQTPDSTNVWPTDWTGVYHFEDDPTAGTLTDASTAGNDKTLYEGTTNRVGWDVDRRVSGKLGQGYAVSASDTTAIRSVGDSPTSDSIFTIAAWCSLTTTSTDFFFQADPGFIQLAAQASNANPRIQFKDFGRVGTGGAEADSNLTVDYAPENGIPQDGWHYLAASFNATTERIDVYLDGSKQNIWTAGGADTTSVWDGYLVGSSGNQWGFMGPKEWNALDGYDGGFDEFMFVDRQLVPDEINALYVSQSDPEAWLAVPPGDVTAPTIASSLALTDSTVQIFFDEHLDPTTGATAGNYSIDGGITVSDAKVESQTSAVLLTSTLTGDQGYTITVSAVEDTLGNAITSAETSFVIRTENAGAMELTGSFSAFNPGQFNFAYPDTVTSAAVTYVRNNLDNWHVYLWDGDSYLDNEITGYDFSDIGVYIQTYLRIFKDPLFPDNQWYVIRADPYNMLSQDTGDTTVTTQGPFSHEEGTSGISGPDLGF